MVDTGMPCNCGFGQPAAPKTGGCGTTGAAETVPKVIVPWQAELVL